LSHTPLFRFIRFNFVETFNFHLSGRFLSLAHENMPSSPVFANDGFGCRVVDVEDFCSSVDAYLLFDDKFDKLFSGLNDGNNYLYGYFLVVGIRVPAIRVIDCVVG